MTSPKTHNILVLPGDGIGPEVMAEALKVLHAFESPTLKFNLTNGLIGGCSIDAHNDSLTDSVRAAALAADAVLFGSVGGPKWDGMRKGFQGPEGGVLRLRQAMEIYGNIRPCIIPSWEVARAKSAFKPEVIEGVDFIVLRENCGGAYFGRKAEDPDYAMDEWGYSKSEVQRITRLAAYLARRHDPPWPVISLDKANVLASSRLWRRVFEETMTSEFPDLEWRHQLADSASLIMAVNPRALNGVILGDNTFGDMLSDQAASIPGTLGVLPSASLSGVPGGKDKVYGLYEPTHGSAPDIAGQGKADPVAMILCVSMMFRYSFNMDEEAQIIDDAVSTVLDSGVRTPDLGGKATTSVLGDAIAAQVHHSLKQLRSN